MAGLGYTPTGAGSPQYRSGIRLKRDRCLSEFLTPTGGSTPWLAKLQNNLGFASALGCGRVDVTLTPAQITSMNATPVTLVPAQAGVTAMIEGPIFIRFTFISPAYTGGGAVVIQYHTGAVAASVTLGANQITAGVSSDQIMVALPNTATNVIPTIGDSLEVTNATAAFATGNGTLRLSFTYLLF